MTVAIGKNYIATCRPYIILSYWYRGVGTIEARGTGPLNFK